MPESLKRIFKEKGTLKIFKGIENEKERYTFTNGMGHLRVNVFMKETKGVTFDLNEDNGQELEDIDIVFNIEDIKKCLKKMIETSKRLEKKKREKEEEMRLDETLRTLILKDIMEIDSKLYRLKKYIFLLLEKFETLDV